MLLFWACCDLDGYEKMCRCQDKDKTEWVSRVQLHFALEDPFILAKRIDAAYANRAETDSLLLYNLYIDSMPTEDIPPLTVEQINRMLGMIRRHDCDTPWSIKMLVLTVRLCVE